MQFLLSDGEARSLMQGYEAPEDPTQRDSYYRVLLQRIEFEFGLEAKAAVDLLGCGPEDLSAWLREHAIKASRNAAHAK